MAFSPRQPATTGDRAANRSPRNAYGGLSAHNNQMELLQKGTAPEVYIAEQHAAMARMRSEKELQQAHNNINTEYKKRIEETRELSGRVAHQLQALQSEIAANRVSRDGVLKALAEMQRPLAMTMSWANIRGQRPPSASSAQVDRALDETRHALKGTLGDLTTLLQDLEKAHVGMAAQEEKFKGELQAKQATLLLDRACLSGALMSSMPKDGPLPATSRSMQHVNPLHTENAWRNNTFASMSAGVSAIEASKTTRKRVAAAMKSIEESGRLKKPAGVIDAVQTHAKYNQHHIQSLTYSGKMCQGEVATLDKHSAIVRGTLEKVQQNLREATQRLGLTVVRPQTEAARTGVEEVLEIEVINMRRTEKMLLQQLKELDTKKQRLLALGRKIVTEHAERADSLKMDRACAELALPPLPQSSPRGVAKTSRRH